MKRLYNNLAIPEVWPPKTEERTLDQPLSVPYMKKKPEIINISIGRQLFVDDFLIKESNLKRIFGVPELMCSPIFEPETPMELNDGFCPCACPFNDGIFYDDADHLFKMWYEAGWFDGIAYAQSEDGIHWKRLSQIDPSRRDDRVISYKPGRLRDGAAVWLDYDAKTTDERYKMLVFYRQYDSKVKYYHQKPKHSHDVPGSIPPKEETILYKSSNGIDWEAVGKTGPSGDNSTFFYNPFTKKWGFSIRTFSKLDSRVRVRGYYETDDFYAGRNWSECDVVFWSRADIYDSPDPKMGYYTQIYNLDATPYESIMLGVYSIFLGPPNNVCEHTKMPKINDLKLAYSRDGFHWSRPTYDAFVESSREPGSWNYGYLHPVNGICTVVGDEIYFYYSCFSGKSPKFGSHKYSGGSLGLAKLRRDGFAAMQYDGADGFLLTEKLEFSGAYLFLNSDCSQGELSVELLDENGVVINGFSKDDFLPIKENLTCCQGMWKKNPDLKNLVHKVIRIRFFLKNSKLYSFWITDREDGKSHGYMAAGGPGFRNGADD